MDLMILCQSQNSSTKMATSIDEIVAAYKLLQSLSTDIFDTVTNWISCQTTSKNSEIKWGQTLRLNTKPLRRFSCAEGLYSNKLNAKLLNTLSSLCLTTKPLTKFLNFKVSLGTKSTRAVNFLHHAFSVDANIKRRRWMREFKVPKMKPSNHRNSPTYESDSPVSWSQFSLSPPPSSPLLWLVSVT